MRQRATKQQIAVTIGLLVAVAAAGFWWAPHIRWSYLLSRNNVKSTPVKVVEMPALKPAPGWFSCRAGAVSFKLPPAMADEAERAVAKSPQALTLTTPTSEVTLFIPSEIPFGQETQISHVAAMVQLSPIEFIAASYRTGADDFRWTMSRGESARHQLLLEMAYLYPHAGVLAVETRLDDDQLQGVLMYHDSRSHAMFEWQLKSGKASGFLRFIASHGVLDLDDLRTVCRSLACDESRLGPPLSAAQLAVLADTMEIGPE